MRVERTGLLATGFCAVALASAATVAAGSANAVPAENCVPAGGTPARGSAAFNAGEIPFPPLQLALSTPFEPTLVRGGEFHYLVYELHLRNYSDAPMVLHHLAVVPGPGERDGTVAVLAGAGLRERLIPVGFDGLEADGSLPGGRAAIAMVCLAFADAGRVPARVTHHVRVGDALAVGASIGTRHVAPKVLAPPVSGPDWIADNGPGLHSHHRTGLFVVDGQPRISRRFAIDWKQAVDGATFAGDARDVTAYFAYGEPVFAVADATVVAATDGLPDNIPRTADGFSPAVALTMDNVAGNAVVLDLGDGQFAYYAHLRPGSVRVKAGDRVRRGDPLAQIGNSGDARWPHLHFQVATGPHILAAEGVPFLIDTFSARDGDGTWRAREREFPMGNIAVAFPAPAAATTGDATARD